MTNGTKRKRIPTGSPTISPTAAWLSGVSPDGQVWIRLRADAEPVGASVAWQAAPRTLFDAIQRCDRVLVIFLDGDSAQPVIIGPLLERLDLAAIQSDATPERLEIRARDAIRLVCGEARIELDSDGTVRTWGADIRSVSTGTTHVEGAEVKIN